MTTAANAVDAEVAIIGAGPVGLTLAIDLAAARPQRRHARDARARRAAEREVQSRRGANDGAVPPPRRRRRRPRRRPAARTIRTTSCFAPRSPAASCRASTSRRGATRYSDTSGPDGWWPTPEPPHRINQIYLEPILFAHAEAKAGVTIRNRCEATGFVQDERRRDDLGARPRRRRRDDACGRAT